MAPGLRGKLIHDVDGGRCRHLRVRVRVAATEGGRNKGGNMGQWLDAALALL